MCLPWWWIWDYDNPNFTRVLTHILWDVKTVLVIDFKCKWPCYWQLFLSFEFFSRWETVTFVSFGSVCLLSFAPILVRTAAVAHQHPPSSWHVSRSIFYIHGDIKKKNNKHTHIDLVIHYLFNSALHWLEINFQNVYERVWTAAVTSAGVALSGVNNRLSPENKTDRNTARHKKVPF